MTKIAENMATPARLLCPVTPGIISSGFFIQFTRMEGAKARIAASTIKQSQNFPQFSGIYHMTMVN